MLIKQQDKATFDRLMVGPYRLEIVQYGPVSDFSLPVEADAFIDRSARDGNEPDFTCIISEEQLPDISKYDCIAALRGGPMPYSISRMGKDELLWIRYDNRDKVRLAYLISEGWSKWRLIADRSKTKGEDCFWELGFIFAYSVLKKAGLMLHGVVMEWSGMGILVCAPSGTGKSTHTNMWESREKARIINGDKALCFRDGDVWYSSGAPWCGSSGKYINKRVPISAIILLERGKTNSISRISPLEGAINLIGLAYAPDWSVELTNLALDLLDELVKRVPVYRLSCRPDYGAVDVLKQELLNLKGLV